MPLLAPAHRSCRFELTYHPGLYPDRSPLIARRWARGRRRDLHSVHRPRMAKLKADRSQADSSKRNMVNPFNSLTSARPGSLPRPWGRRNTSCTPPTIATR